MTSSSDKLNRGIFARLLSREHGDGLGMLFERITTTSKNSNAMDTRGQA